MSTSVFKKVSLGIILVGIAFIVRPAPAVGQSAQILPPQPDPVVAGLVNQLQFAQSDHDRQKAAKELGKIADPGTLSVLVQAAVYDDDSSVRKEARKSAQHVSGNLPPRQGLVFPQGIIGALMAQMLDSRKDDDRENAARQLGAMPDPASLPALEIAAAFDDDGGVRDAARKAAVMGRKVLAARAAQAATPVVVVPQPATEPTASVVAPAVPTTPPPVIYTVPVNPTVVAVPTAPPTVVVPPPVYYYPAPPVYYYPAPAYYYPRPAYYYPGPARYYYPGPRVSIGVGFGFGFGHYHHR